MGKKVKKVKAETVLETVPDKEIITAYRLQATRPGSNLIHTEMTRKQIETLVKKHERTIAKSNPFMIKEGFSFLIQDQKGILFIESDAEQIREIFTTKKQINGK